MLTTESSDANIKCASFSANKFEVKHLDWKNISKEGSIKPTAVSWAPLPQKTTHLWHSLYFIYMYKVYIAIKKQNQFLSFNITGSFRVSFGTDTHQECSNVSKRSLYQKVHIAVKNKPCVFQLCCATCSLKVHLN